MYTVFEPNGRVRMHRGFIPAFVRTLKNARELAQPGDTITGWSSSGHARIVYSVQAGNRLTKLSRAS